jgi:hypothetical protein
MLSLLPSESPSNKLLPFRIGILMLIDYAVLPCEEASSQTQRCEAPHSSATHEVRMLRWNRPTQKLELGQSCYVHPINASCVPASVASLWSGIATQAQTCRTRLPLVIVTAHSLTCTAVCHHVKVMPAVKLISCSDMQKLMQCHSSQMGY